MFLHAQQIQFPVGQGGVHLAQVRLLSDKGRLSRRPLSLMFDCGGIGSPSALSTALSVVRLALPTQSRKRRLHLLVLSHLHADHINGFRQLIQSNPLTIDRLIIPHYDDEDRLVLMAQLANQTADIDRVMEVDQVLSDPGRWFGERGVGQVIQVSPGSGEVPIGRRPESPTSDPKVMPPEDAGGLAGLSLDLFAADGKPVLSAPSQVVKNGVVAKVLVNGPQKGAGQPDWLALPFCLRTAPGHGGHRDKVRFVKAVREIVAHHRTSAGVLNVSPPTAATVLGALTNEFRLYVGGQHQTWNALSLSLFNGLERKRVFERYATSDRSFFAFVETPPPWPPRKPTIPRHLIYLDTTDASAWMHTGDSELISGAAEWSTFYQAYKDRCLMFQMPHHGSANNFDGTLSLVPNSVAFATCRSSSQNHPASSVRNLVRGQAVELHEVNELSASLLQSLTVARI